MSHVKIVAILVLVAGALLCAAASPAGASGDGSCTAREAHAAVRAAERALVRAQHRLDEARHVERATRAYSCSYGTAVGRWVRLARRTGWPWPALPDLMFVIKRESGGDPRAANPTSSASGLLQLMAVHWSGRFDPFVARLNLAYGAKLWRGSRFAAWAM